jgi:hypothetical protein
MLVWSQILGFAFLRHLYGYWVGLRSKLYRVATFYFRDGADDDSFVICSRPDSGRRVEHAAQYMRFNCSFHPYGGPVRGGRGAGSNRRQADCVAAVDAIRAEWRALSHSSSLKAAQRIRTEDGRELAGSQVNYSYVLIGRAEHACAAGQVERARGYADEANEVLHPRPSGLMLAMPAGN